MHSSIQKPNLAIFEQLYEDIVQNAKENLKLMELASTSISHDAEWINLTAINEEQGLKLKEVFMKIVSTLI